MVTDHMRLRPAITSPVALEIARREVERGDIEPVMARLAPLLADGDEAWRHRGQVSLVVRGYEADDRSLVDVPQVRDLLRQLEARWSEWGFFLNQVDDSIKLLIACAGGHEFGGGGWAEVSVRRMDSLLQRGLQGIDAVFHRFGFAEKEWAITKAGLIEVFDQARGH